MAPSTITPVRGDGSEAGFSLVEMLVTLAITVMVGVSLLSVLLAIATNGRRESRQTDHYESLRLAAHSIVQDARQSRKAENGGSFLKLYTTSPPNENNYIKYTFSAWDGTSDPNNLHRWVLEGGVLKSDAIIASDLVPFCASSPNCTHFSSSDTFSDKHAWANLVKAPIRGQQTPTRMVVWGLLR